jgi:hypothetical protein
MVAGPQAFTYVLTYFFKSHSTAQTVVLLINLFCMILLIAAFVMELITSTCKVNQVMEYFYRYVAHTDMRGCRVFFATVHDPCPVRLRRLMPGFALGNGLIQVGAVVFLRAVHLAERCVPAAALMNAAVHHGRAPNGLL